MTETSPIRATPRRRLLRAQSALNGFDSVDPGEDRRILLVRFFQAAPASLAPEHFVVTGGIRVRDPNVVEVRFQDDDDAHGRQVHLVLDRPADESTYGLAVRGLDGFDPRFAQTSFSFGGTTAPRRHASRAPVGTARPELDYLAKDYEGFRRVAFARLAQTLPGWAERHAPDVGVMLVDMMAYVGDQISYFQDAVATEAYIGTARLRTSVRRHARLIDYAMHEGCNARVWLHLSTDADLVVAAADIGFAVGYDDPRLVFTPIGVDPIRLFLSLNAIAFYSWGVGDTSLAEGSVTATFRDAWTTSDREGPRRLDALESGQALLIETLPGHRGPSRRHVVRLRTIEQAYDPLLDVPLVVVSWAAEDALPFDLPFETDGDTAAVARGNMVLADHGRRVDDETLAASPAGTTRRRVALRESDLTFSQALDAEIPATMAVRQDPRRAVPQILSLSAPLDPSRAASGSGPVAWQPRPDLIASGADDPHVVVEMDDEGRAWLRFGDGRFGASPGPGDMTACYRVGNGPIGNVGAETIGRVVALGATVLAGVAVRNPLPATGGTAPEAVADVKQFAPSTFRAWQERCITADDYRQAARRVFGVRDAKVALVQLGATRLARVAILPSRGEDPSLELLDQVRAHLSVRRRIGHDVEVRAARFVALDVAVTIGVREGTLRAHVRRAVREALGVGVAGTGLFSPGQVGFGEPVRGSRIIAAAQGAAGVAWVRLTRLRRLRDRCGSEDDEATTLTLAPFEVARMDDDPAYPEHGHLTLTLVGGR